MSNEKKQERRQERSSASNAQSMRISQPAASTGSSYVSPYRDRTPANTNNSQYGLQIKNLQNFNNGGTGFGAAALQRARAGGMSDKDIRDGIFYGRYNVGESAYGDLFGNNQRASNTMSGRSIRREDGTVSNVSGYGTANWGADTLKHMDERRNYLSSLGIQGAHEPERAQEALAAKGWQPSNSFAELGDQRWYSNPVTDDVSIPKIPVIKETEHTHKLKSLIESNSCNRCKGI